MDTSFAETNIFSGNPMKIKKCTYQAHIATVWSVEHAIQVLDFIGQNKDSEDVLPFAIRLVEGGETILIKEDNGEFGSGDILMDSLSKLEDYNVLVCVTRSISGNSWWSAQCTELVT